MVDLKWQRTFGRCRHPEPCQCDTNIHTSILGDPKGGSYLGVIFSFTNWWRVKLNLFKIWKTCAIYELKFRGWVLLYIDRMQGTPGTGEEAEETGYRVLGTTQGVIEETIHQRQALNWNLDFGYSYGTFCPHRVAEITAHRHSWSCRSVKDDKISVQLWTCHLTSPRPFSKVISRQWIDRKSQMALKVNLCGQHLTKSHWDNLVH